jgi:hypothetical protein
VAGRPVADTRLHARTNAQNIASVGITSPVEPTNAKLNIPVLQHQVSYLIGTDLTPIHQQRALLTPSRTQISTPSYRNRGHRQLLPQIYNDTNTNRNTVKLIAITPAKDGGIGYGTLSHPPSGILYIPLMRCRSRGAISKRQQSPETMTSQTCCPRSSMVSCH